MNRCSLKERRTKTPFFHIYINYDSIYLFETKDILRFLVLTGVVKPPVFRFHISSDRNEAGRHRFKEPINDAHGEITMLVGGCN